MILDKTGTITLGAPVTDIVLVEGDSEDSVLQLRRAWSRYPNTRWQWPIVDS